MYYDLQMVRIIGSPYRRCPWRHLIRFDHHCRGGAQMISYLKSLTLKQRANGILGLTAVLYCFAFVGQFFFGHESWYQPLYWAVQSALIGSVADWFAVTALFASH